MSTMQAAIETLRGFAERSGCTVAQLETAEQSFGNFVMIIESRRLRLRITRDRGQFFCDVARKRFSLGWRGFAGALVATGFDASAREPWPSADALVDACEKHFANLEKATAWKPWIAL
jgi:hypothetical protein